MAAVQIVGVIVTVDKIVTYDIECYPNVFTLIAKDYVIGCYDVFEISDRRNDALDLVRFIHDLAAHGVRMVGFNNLGYDYPLLHYILQNGEDVTPALIYTKSQAIIASESPFEHVIWPNDRIIEQIDLYKIHHFDNNARRTSLKVLEFNMRSSSIQDLPYDPSYALTSEQIDELLYYNKHDVDETEKFLIKSIKAIEFRDHLSSQYDRDFTNHNDTKIGKDYFIMRLDEAGIPCYEKDNSGRRQPRQTRRPYIDLAPVIFPYITFASPEFNRILEWFKQQRITETKGVFKDLSVTVGGFQFDFGTGGIHGSIESRIVRSDDTHVVIDLDVASYYPNLAIANRIYPAHLGDAFCDIYQDVFEQRKQHKKGTPENAMLKLALNGVYGDSNNPYSPFYDPSYTMAITINGQLLLCMLAEWLMTIPTLEMVQINTDGLTVRIDRRYESMVDGIKREWETFTRLELESATYSRMFIRDVNNYIAEYENGDVKRKGAYEYKREWHQNHSALVIPKAAESALLDGIPVEEYILSHTDIFDFMLRAKIPRSSHLVLVDDDGNETKQQNTTRYYVTQEGGSLVKIMPPLARKPDVWRRIGIDVGWKVTVCNDIADATVPINPDYYITEAKKLVECLR